MNSGSPNISFLARFDVYYAANNFNFLFLTLRIHRYYLNSYILGSVCLMTDWPFEVSLCLGGKITKKKKGSPLFTLFTSCVYSFVGYVLAIACLQGAVGSLPLLC